MNRIAIGLALFTVVACARTPAPSPAPSPAMTTATPGSLADSAGRAPIKVRIPPAVASFAMKTRRDYEDASAGTQLRYQAADSTIADVYVYPGPDLATRCSMTCARDVLANEVKDFESSFPEIIRLGYMESMAVTGQAPLTPPDDAAWRLGHHLTLSVKRDGLVQRSELYLYYLPGYRVKVRATYPETPERIVAVRNFADAIVPALTRP